MKIRAGTGKEQEIDKKIKEWIKEKEVGYEEGEHGRDPKNRDNTIGDPKTRKDPGSGCQVQYRVSKQNCNWWAQMMLHQSGIDIANDELAKMKKYNLDAGTVRSDRRRLYEDLFGGESKP